MDYTTIAQWLNEARNIVILTGAGMSTESGIPDFRSTEGRWRNIDPLTGATTDAYALNYDVFHDFYCARIAALDGVTPHIGHEIIAKWQRTRQAFIATQNVDRLHQLAGAAQVAELHGTIRTVRCGRCEQEAALQAFIEKETCTCGGTLRPNVVLFGEPLPDGAWDTTMQSIQEADLVVVIGTSLRVYPVNQLPTMTNGKCIYINLQCEDDVAASYTFDAILTGKAGDILQGIDQALQLK